MARKTATEEAIVAEPAAEEAAAPAPAAEAVATEPARDPNEPIGTPPSGGRWTWDVPGQAWLQLDAPSA